MKSNQQYHAVQTLQGINGPAGPVKIATLLKSTKESSLWVRIRREEQLRDFRNKSEKMSCLRRFGANHENAEEVLEHKMKKLNLK